MSDPLFGGLRRPGTVWGIPVPALLTIMMLGSFSFILTISFRMGLVAGFAVMMLTGLATVGARIVAAQDARIFEYWGLWFQTTGSNRGLRFWKAATYSPLKNRKNYDLAD